MAPNVRALVTWIPKNEGGRNIPPVGPRYVSVVRFEEAMEAYSKNAWSLVIEFARRPGDSLVVEAVVSFLMDDAPHHLLHPGGKFEIFEGSRKVGYGEVISVIDPS